MEYIISIQELIQRPLLRNDRPHEYLNKMTSEEETQFEKEIEKSLELEGIEKKFPDWNAAFLAKLIDRSILYELFSMANHQIPRIPRKVKKKIIKTFGIGSYRGIMKGALTIEKYHKGRGCITKLTEHGKQINSQQGRYFFHSGQYNPYVTFRRIK